MQSGEGVGDHVGPGPVDAEAEDALPAGRDQTGGRREQPEPELLGSQRRAGTVSASIGIQASRSSASWTISSQSWLLEVWCRGRLRRPVSRAARMRSSARARWRCRSSRAAMAVPVVLVAKQVSRIPSASVNRNWAPGCGRSFRTMSRIPVGQPLRTSPPVRRPRHRLGTGRRFRPPVSRPSPGSVGRRGGRRR